MKVRSLKKALQRLEKKYGNLDDFTVAVCIKNEYGVCSDYEVLQARGTKHPFLREGHLLFEMGELTIVN